MKRVITATCLAASFAVGLAAQSTGTAGTAGTPGTPGTTAQDPQGRRTARGRPTHGDRLPAGGRYGRHVHAHGRRDAGRRRHGGRHRRDAPAAPATGRGNAGRAPRAPAARGCAPIEHHLTSDASVDLKAHVGHKVEVTGTLAGGRGRAGTDAAALPARRPATTASGTTRHHRWDRDGDRDGQHLGHRRGRTGTGQGGGRGPRNMTVTSVRMISSPAANGVGRLEVRTSSRRHQPHQGQLRRDNRVRTGQLQRQLACSEASMARSIWKGSIAFGLVNIPVELYSATRDHRPKFRLLHAKDEEPVKYERVCQKEGKPVAWEDLVKGYEYAKGQFVVLTKDDFKTAALEKTKTIDILDFVDPAGRGRAVLRDAVLPAAGQGGRPRLRAAAGGDPRVGKDRDLQDDPARCPASRRRRGHRGRARADDDAILGRAGRSEGVRLPAQVRRAPRRS